MFFKVRFFSISQNWSDLYHSLGSLYSQLKGKFGIRISWSEETLTVYGFWHLKLFCSESKYIRHWRRSDSYRWLIRYIYVLTIGTCQHEQFMMNLDPVVKFYVTLIMCCRFSAVIILTENLIDCNLTGYLDEKQRTHLYYIKKLHTNAFVEMSLVQKEASTVEWLFQWF